MAYPDLPPSPTFWRCPNCGNETLFRGNGTAAIKCIGCGQTWTVQQLKDAHASAAATSQPA